MTTTPMNTDALGVPRRRTGGRVRGSWRRRMISILGVASLALVWLVAAPAQAQTTQCTGVLQNGTVLGSVVVPPGSACVLLNMNVLGPVMVGASSDLILSSSMVASVTGTTDSFVYAENGSVVAGGGVTLTQSYGMWLIDSLVFGNTTASSGGSLFPVLYMSDDTNYAGNLTLKGAWTVLRGGQINGGIDSDAGHATDAINMTVTGPISIRGSAMGSLLCGIALGNNLWLSDNHKVLQIGGPFPTPTCTSNFVSGSVDVHNNTASQIQISGNIVSGNLACTGNTPAPLGFGNIVFGTTSGQCAGLSILGGGIMAAGPLIPPPGVPGSNEAIRYEERRAGIEELLLERLADAGWVKTHDKPTAPEAELPGMARLAP